jgi:hypothetical protein
MRWFRVPRKASTEKWSTSRARVTRCRRVFLHPTYTHTHLATSTKRRKPPLSPSAHRHVRQEPRLLSARNHPHRNTPHSKLNTQNGPSPNPAHPRDPPPRLPAPDRAHPRKGRSTARRNGRHRCRRQCRCHTESGKSSAPEARVSATSKHIWSTKPSVKHEYPRNLQTRRHTVKL